MRLDRRVSTLFALLVAFAPAFAVADDPFYLKDGDRVVFYGDSITDQRLYTTFTEAFVVTRFPKLKVDFVHSGWGGDRVTGGGGGPIDVRLNRDVIAYKPTVMTIMLGMNDASYRPFDQRIFDTYANGYRHILDKVKHDVPDLRLTLIGPSPFDDVCQAPRFEGGYNAVLVRYAEFVKGLAAEKKATYADLNTPVVDATKKAFASDPELAKKLNPDRIHPALGGQLLMSAALLKSWNAPSLVSQVEIDAAAPGRVVEKNTKTTSLAANNGTLTWTQLDESLPFPIDFKDAATRLAVQSSSLMNDLDRQILRVVNLEKPRYTLRIDGKEVGAFTKDQLAQGVNLAEHPTPMLEQARRVYGLTLEHNNVHFTRWRQVQVPYASESPGEAASAVDALDAIEAKVVKKQREAAEPRPHAFELTPNG